MDKNVDLINKKIVFFKINKAVEEENMLPKKTSDITVAMLKGKEDQVYSATMGFWRCAMDNCTKADYAVALYKDVVAGVFPVNHMSWYYVSDVNPDKIPTYINQKRSDVEDIKKIQKGESPSSKNLTKKRVCFFKSNDPIDNEVYALVGNTVYSKKKNLKPRGQSVIYSWDIKKSK